MKVVIDVRQIRGKKNKRHADFADFVFNKAIQNENAEVYLRGRGGFELVAVNGIVGKE